MKKVFLAALTLLLATAGMAAAEETWLEIGGDYRFRYDYLKGTVHDYTQLVPSSLAGGAPAGMPVYGYSTKNTALLTNRFGLNLKANPVEDVTMKARLLMYKIYGHQTAEPGLGYFGDRNNLFGTNDGTVGHVPEDSIIRADYVYATISNIFDMPIWFSVGRRPSTGGMPGNYRLNKEKMGTAGIPNLLVDYAFDGATLGFAPDIEALPGAYAKLCAGKGFDSGFRGDPAPLNPQTGLKDTDFIGLNVVPFDTENLHIEAQYQVGKHLFDRPSDAGVGANLGDIEWYGGVVTTKVGNLNIFASAAVSKTDPTGAMGIYDVDGDGVTDAAGGLLNMPGSTEPHSGTAYYVGGRFDIAATGTKIGAEYNHGSKYWIGMVPAADDIWTGKLGTRGDVYEVYIIQSLNRKPVAKRGDAFVRLGYQEYNFDYTGSNFWIGPPVSISDLQATTDVNQANFFAAVDKAKDIYLTFDFVF